MGKKWKIQECINSLQNLNLHIVMQKDLKHIILNFFFNFLFKIILFEKYIMIYRRHKSFQTLYKIFRRLWAQE